MTTHPGILAFNEFLNLRMSSDTDNIRAIYYFNSRFASKELFNAMKKVITKLGYKVDTNLGTLQAFYMAIRDNQIDKASVSFNNNLKLLYEALSKVLGTGHKISFSDRTRYGELFCIYTTDKVEIKTNTIDSKSASNLYNQVIKLFVSSGLIHQPVIQVKPYAADVYNIIFNNLKKTIDTSNKRGYSPFAIACYIQEKNKSYFPKPFMHHWSNLNFFKALMSSELFERNVSAELKSQTPSNIDYWTVLSEQSLLTGKVMNIDSRRKAINLIINEALDSEGNAFIKQVLYNVKLAQSSGPEETFDIGTTNNLYKDTNKIFKELINKNLTPIPSKEDLLYAIQIQFRNARIKDYDFSLKRKDHLILNKLTRKRIFDIL